MADMIAEGDILLDVRDLRTYFGAKERPLRAVDGVSFVIREGETVALVGESGCGKSVAALSLARLVPQPPGFYAGGEILYRGRDVLRMSEREVHELRGAELAYIFQEPSASLNPVFTVGYQIGEALRLHRSDADVMEETARLLDTVGIPASRSVMRLYPHQLSGGTQQRVMIAMALACRPKLLIADEPTTALDVTVQAQILDLLVTLQAQFGMSLLLITHNFGLVAEIAHRVYVMYAGRIVEGGPAEDILRQPHHPYTRALLAAVPRLEGTERQLQGIEGTVPQPDRLPSGCKFHPRCPKRVQRCCDVEPEWESLPGGRGVRCHFWK